MRDQDGDHSPEEFFERHSYLDGDGVTLELVTRVMHAIARVTASAPWRDRNIDGLVVDIEDPIPRQLVVYVREHQPRFPLWQLLPSPRAFAALAGPLGECEGHYGDNPRRVAIEYGPLGHRGIVERRDLARHQWPIVGTGIPGVYVWDDVDPVESASAADLTDVALVADALANVREAMTPALWRSAPTIDCTIEVAPLGRPVAVRIRGPLWRAFDPRAAATRERWAAPPPIPVGVPFTEAAFSRLEHTSDLDAQLVAEPRIDLVHEEPAVRAQFLAFAHDGGGPALDAIGWLNAVLHADQGPRVTEIGAATLELLLLERLPACALVTRDDVPVLLDDLRAWFRWSVAHGNPLAAGCLGALDDDLARLLGKFLADERRFNLAKAALFDRTRDRSISARDRPSN